ncbi:hypothetical protein [Microbulbifer sp. TRSA005]|uniref:hypothetical protein n=1 Tax=Microbulbifer sp. TRSA005 TaxID=3243383 RepID=UPI0040396A86
MRSILLTIFLALASQATACGECDLVDTLSRISEFKNISREKLSLAIDQGKWNKWKSAYALCYKEESSQCYLIIFGAGDPHVTDMSKIEHANLGKLGAPGTKYKNVKTTVTKWFYSDNRFFQLELKTVAYRDGQRLTVTEPVFVKKNGELIYR